MQEANRRLEDVLRTSQREQFGKRSEKLKPDEFNRKRAARDIGLGL